MRFQKDPDTCGPGLSELLQKDSAVTIHTKNLQLLMTEM